MKRTFVLSLAMLVLISALFTACSGNDDSNDGNDGSDTNLESYDGEVGFEKDEDGNDVAVIYKLDEKGNTIAVKLGSDGEPVTDENGKEVTVKTTYQLTTKKAEQTANEGDTKNLTTTTTQKPTGTTNKNIPNTSSADTTKFDEKTETVPKTSATGERVNFSAEDQAIIKSMLEVPYLYLANYENSDGVPISIACHTAVWMAERSGNIRSTYPSGTVVLNLFYYFGQTVVNFKTQCNDFAAKANAPIKYDKSRGTFEISEFTSKKQTVSITGIENLGNNNFYKVSADVKGCEKKKVVAIIQKNRLDPTLGFSIKALKWS